MTHQECLDLLAPKHHHELLWNAASIARISSDADEMVVQIPHVLDGVANPEFCLMMRTHEGQEPPLQPRAPVWRSCDPAIQQKVIGWATWYLKQTRMTRTVQWLVDWLFENCDNGHQIRFLWPAILHLTAKSDNSDVEAWVKKYGLRVVPRNMPRITPEIRRILTETSEWCAQCVLIEDVKKAAHQQTTISYNNNYEFNVHTSEDSFVVLTRVTFA